MKLLRDKRKRRKHPQTPSEGNKEPTATSTNQPNKDQKKTEEGERALMASTVGAGDSGGKSTTSLIVKKGTCLRLFSFKRRQQQFV